jgi:hypothetical protein
VRQPRIVDVRTGGPFTAHRVDGLIELRQGGRIVRRYFRRSGSFWVRFTAGYRYETSVALAGATIRRLSRWEIPVFDGPLCDAPRYMPSVENVNGGRFAGLVYRGTTEDAES